MDASGCAVRKLLLILSFLDTLNTRLGTTYGSSSQAFIQTDSELRYLADGVAVLPINDGASSSDTSGLSDAGTSGINVLGIPIQFEPPEVDFLEQPVGIPVIRKIYVRNLNTESSIQLLSISGNTIHFHCSFFTDKVIPPSGNTSFDVVFLGREEGLAWNTLYIHTSAGSFRFQVKAVGLPSPYHLKPLVGVKLPLHASYNPIIEMHNPHAEAIQVMEMYSSGGDLHLELPSGEMEGPLTLWQIPPYQTKSVIKVNFVARLESNHTAYIRIKTNTTGAEFLYLPLEVEVSSQPGIYCPQELIDFGLLPSNGEPLSLKLLVLNSGQKAITIQNVIATPVSEALSIDFESIKVSPDTMHPTVVAHVFFNPTLVPGDGLYTGKLVIKSKNNQYKVTVPYRAKVVSGRLWVNESSTKFHLDPLKAHLAPNLPYNLTVKNEFKVPVAVHNLTLAKPASQFFKLSSFTTLILYPEESRDIVTLTLTPEAWQLLTLDSYLVLHTNISSMKIPLTCFHGQLDTFLPGSASQDVLDFGTLGMGEKRDLYFTVMNRNPINLELCEWGSNVSLLSMELMGLEKGNETHVLQRTNFSNMARKMTLYPGHYMIFRIGILTPEHEGLTNGAVFIKTNYHHLELPFKFRVAKGSLHTVPKELIFDDVFPGKEAELKLKVFSSFAEDMLTDDVHTVPPDARFRFLKSGSATITSSEKSFIGRVVFDSGTVCSEEETCYSGFATSSKMGREWYRGLTLPKDVGETDLSINQILWKRFKSETAPSSSFNVTLNLDTNQVRGFLFTARANLVWPRLIALDKISFPLTQVGNFSLRELILTNPSGRNLFVHLLPMAVYPNGHEVANQLPLRADKEEAIKKVFASDHIPPLSTFRIVSILDINTAEPMSGFADDLESRFGVPLPQDTKAFILKPYQTARIVIRFWPESVDKFHHGLFIRNNLTGLELVELISESLIGELKFAKWKSHSPQAAAAILEFDMKEKHLRDCDLPIHSSRYSSPVLTVKRSFKAKNTGLTPVFISSYDIEGLPCEGYGFRVLNCEPATLESGESMDVDIAFTPDFTLSKVSRTLTLHTQLSPELKELKFTLLATVPAHMLSVCSMALPRPSWEAYLYYIFNLALFLLFLCVMIAAWHESDRIAKIGDYTAPVNQQIVKCYHMHDLQKDMAEGVINDLNQRHNQCRAASSTYDEGAPPVLAKERPEVSWASLPVCISKSLILFFSRILSYFGCSAFCLMRWLLSSFTSPSSPLPAATDVMPDEIRDDEEVEDDEEDEEEEEEEEELEEAEEDEEYDENDEELDPDPDQEHDQDRVTSTSQITFRQNSSSKKVRSRNKKRKANKSEPLQPALSHPSPLSPSPAPPRPQPRQMEDVDSSSTCTEESSVLDEDDSRRKLCFLNNNNNGQNVKINTGSSKKSHKSKASTNGSDLTKKKESSSTAGGASKDKPQAGKQMKDKRNSAKGSEDIAVALPPSKLAPSEADKSTCSDKGKLQVKPAKAKIKQQAKVKPIDAIGAQLDDISSAVPPAPAATTSASVPASTGSIMAPATLSTVTTSTSTLAAASSCASTVPVLPICSAVSITTNTSVVAATTTTTTSVPAISVTSAGMLMSSANVAPLAPSTLRSNKITPIGKILPEIKKPENLGAQFGPIGAKPVVSGPSPPTKLSSMFITGPDPHRPSSSIPVSLSGVSPPTPRPLTDYPFSEPLSLSTTGIDMISGNSGMHHHHTGSISVEGPGLVGESAGMGSLMSGSHESPSRATLMQTLQLERRQRTEEYFLRQQSDWPGFGTMSERSFIETLWDVPPTASEPTSRSAWNDSMAWPSPMGSLHPPEVGPSYTSNGFGQTFLGFNDGGRNHSSSTPPSASIWNQHHYLRQPPPAQQQQHHHHQHPHPHHHHHHLQQQQQAQSHLRRPQPDMQSPPPPPPPAARMGSSCWSSTLFSKPPQNPN